MKKFLAKISKKTTTPVMENPVTEKVEEKIFVKNVSSKKAYPNFGPKVTHALMKAEKRKAKV